MTSRVLSADAVWNGDGVVGDRIQIKDGLITAVETGGSVAGEHHDGVIVPRFIDSHFHPFEYIQSQVGVSLGTPNSIDEILRRLADEDATLPAGVALVANRFDDSVVGRMPTAAELDRVSEDRPILVHRICCHIASANTATLRMAEVDDETADPAGGAFRRDDRGRPTGVVDEVAVAEVAAAVGSHIPIPDDESGLAVLDELVSMGLARIGAIVSLPTDEGAPFDPLETLRRVGDHLPLDFDVIVHTDEPADLSRASELLLDMTRARLWGWKTFADGSLGGRTAALSTPYWDQPDTRGTSRLDGDHALQMTHTSIRLGGVAAFHAIGDAALTDVLDVFDRAIAQGTDPTRLRVEHASVASPSLIERFADLGVVASVQPSFPVSDDVWLGARLGPDRLSWAYPFEEMAARKIPLIFSSDAPVESPDVVTAMTHAVSSGLAPEQALAGYTTTPGRLLGLEKPLAVGSSADFVIIDGPPGSATSVVDVWVDGEPLGHSHAN